MRHGKTIGSPIAMTIANNDWKNWEEILPVDEGDPEKHKAVACPRPGHADLAGASSTTSPTRAMCWSAPAPASAAARVACGALAKMLLRSLGIEVASHVIRVGKAELSRQATFAESRRAGSAKRVLLTCVDPETEARMKAEVDAALRTGDTIGGVFEVIVHGLPPGVGTHANWDERLDGLLAQAVMSLQAVKAVEIGRGVTAARVPRLHRPRRHRLRRRPAEGAPPSPKFSREHNNAGGIEGGISNGEDVVVRGYLKPISTLRRPLASVSASRPAKPTKAAYERSDVCVVPAAGVAAEAMVALCVARLVLEKFGGDSLRELQRNYNGYCEQIRAF